MPSMYQQFLQTIAPIAPEIVVIGNHSEEFTDLPSRTINGQIVVDLVRVTGYMVRLSDIERLRAAGSRINSTVLGADSVENWGLLDRVPRVISTEFDPRLGALVR